MIDLRVQGEQLPCRLHPITDCNEMGWLARQRVARREQVRGHLAGLRTPCDRTEAHL